MGASRGFFMKRVEAVAAATLITSTVSPMSVKIRREVL